MYDPCTVVAYLAVAPEIDLPNKRIGQEPGRETMLECVITAFPQALSVWMRNGKEIKDSHKHRLEVYNEGDHRITLSLRIMDITAHDYGNYSCYASNKLGNDMENMFLYGRSILETVADFLLRRFRISGIVIFLNFFFINFTNYSVI